MSIIRLGCIGVDSSHLPEFSRRIAALNDEGATRCRVTHFWTDGRHDWPNADDVATWIEKTRAMGVVQSPSLEALLDSVDGVLVLAVNGRRHLDLATPALRRGIATYIDKPLTCSLVEARRVLAMSRETSARCYSASSLRFIRELESIPFATLGRIRAIDAFGAGELLDMMPHLWHYGCHSIEMVDAIFHAAGVGAGVRRISAIAEPDRHLVDYEYRDGRYVRMRLERAGAWGFGATIHGEKAVHQFVVDFTDVYTRLVRGMVGFFEGKPAPVELRDIVETVAVMEAGNRSIERGGQWVDVEEVC
jgi:predicted dehydrogenase